MNYIKRKFTLIHWLQIGYNNWDDFKCRKLICYHGKLINFQWNKDFFDNVQVLKAQLNYSHLSNLE